MAHQLRRFRAHRPCGSAASPLPLRPDLLALLDRSTHARGVLHGGETILALKLDDADRVEYLVRQLAVRARDVGRQIPPPHLELRIL